MTVWFVTGASRGLGLALVRSLLSDGQRVVATARGLDALRAQWPEGHDNLLCLALDISRQDQADAAVASVLEKFGRIDVLVNNAGYGQLGAFEETSAALIRAQFDTNVFGTMNVTRAVLPVMRRQRQGHIFTVTSMSGHVGSDGTSVYCASKFALEGWMDCLHLELQRFGINVTAVAPGFFRTDFLDQSSMRFADRPIEDYAGVSAEKRAALSQRNHQQVGNPARVASVLQRVARTNPRLRRLFLGSDCLAALSLKVEALQADIEQNRPLSPLTDGGH